MTGVRFRPYAERHELGRGITLVACHNQDGWHPSTGTGIDFITYAFLKDGYCFEEPSFEFVLALMQHFQEDYVYLVYQTCHHCHKKGVV